MENPEVHQPHPHRRRRAHGGLPRWLELAIAITALTTSISSIVIAIHHGKTMDKLVKANSIPYIIGGFSDITPQGERVLSLDLLNRGVGPAQERSLRVKVDDKYVTSVEKLFAESIGAEQAAAVMQLPMARNKVRTRFIGPGGEQLIFRFPKTPENARYWDQLEAAQPRWSLAYCYCSVFDECWHVAGKFEEPKPIKECARDEPNEFLP
ncbi:MAG TPA: hypothetical protein VJQ52_07615 [Steroidobacteraceae bacterium]|nr:hypothetical protein [Steroidobacteraceae bacterium]